MKVLEFIADYTGAAIGLVFVIVILLAVIRVIVKKHRGENIKVTPVGIANDLPSSITGINKYDDALDTDQKEE